MKFVKRPLLIATFLLLMFTLAPMAFADTTMVWSTEEEAAYDTSIPGTILSYYNPLDQGGMNLTTGSYTTPAEADIVFSSDGKEIAARGVLDLGAVDFDTVSEIPDEGYSKNIRCTPGHVYIVSTHDGSIVKILIEQNLGSSVSFIYAFGEEDVVLPQGTEVTYDMNIPGTILLISNPISQGGLDFAAGEMTTDSNKTDIAISDTDLGSRAIIDLGPEDMDSIDSEPDSGYSKMVDLEAGHVYVTQTHDGRFVKFYVKAVHALDVELIYQEITHEILSIDVSGDISNITKPVQLRVTGKLDNGKIKTIPGSEVTWSSNNTSVATVDSQGVARFTGKPGTVYFTADYDGIQDSYGVVVTVITSIKIDQKIQYSNKPVQLTVTAIYNDRSQKRIPSDIIWASNNKSVATVDTKGIVRFTGKMGTVTITANFKGKVTSVTCTVGNVLISVQPVTKLAYSKKPVQLTIITRYASGKSYVISKGVVWKSSNTNVARVSSSGVVTFTGQNGTVTITGTYANQTASFTTTVFFRENELKYYTGKTWRLYMDYVQLDVGTLRLLSNGTYAWTKPSGQVLTGKWTFNSKNTITLYNFGYNRDLTYEMGRWGNGQVGIFYHNGETGSDYYIGK